MGTWITVGDDKARTAFDVSEDVADSIVKGLWNAINVEPPRHAQEFPELLAVIAQTSRLIDHLEKFRELAIVKADRTSPLADRNKIGMAAAMPPSRIYRILDKHGRPRNRRDAFDAALNAAIDAGAKTIPEAFETAERLLDSGTAAE